MKKHHNETKQKPLKSKKRPHLRKIEVKLDYLNPKKRALSSMREKKISC